MYFEIILLLNLIERMSNDVLGVFNNLIVDYEKCVFEGKNEDLNPSLLIEVPDG